MNINIRVAIYGTLGTILSLVGGLFLGVVIGGLVFDLMPGHYFQNLNPVHVAVASIPGLGGFVLGSVVWGMLMGRLAQATDRKRMAIAGALGFAPIALGLGLLLQVLAPIALNQFGAIVPLHRLFTFFFVPTAFLIAGISAWAIGIGLNDRALARKLFWQIGLTSAIVFLIVNLGMESAGWLVGAPDAAKRFTMLTVMFAGNLAAAIVSGGVMVRNIGPWNY